MVVDNKSKLKADLYFYGLATREEIENCGDDFKKLNKLLKEKGYNTLQEVRDEFNGIR